MGHNTEVLYRYKTCSVKHILRCHLCDKEKVALLDRWPLKRGSIHMKFSMTGQEKNDILIQVTASIIFFISDTK